MTVKLPELLQRILHKCDVLTARYEAVKTLKDKAEAENATLVEENQRLMAQIEKLESENSYLRISHKIAATPEDAARSREVLTRLVRKIDRCIVQLDREEV